MGPCVRITFGTHVQFMIVNRTNSDSKFIPKFIRVSERKVTVVTYTKNIRNIRKLPDEIRTDNEQKKIMRNLIGRCSLFRTIKKGVSHSDNIRVTCIIPNVLRINNELKKFKRDLFVISPWSQTKKIVNPPSNNIRVTSNIQNGLRVNNGLKKLKRDLLGIS